MFKFVRSWNVFRNMGAFVHAMLKTGTVQREKARAREKKEDQKEEKRRTERKKEIGECGCQGLTSGNYAHSGKRKGEREEKEEDCLDLLASVYAVSADCLW